MDAGSFELFNLAVLNLVVVPTHLLTTNTVLRGDDGVLSSGKCCRSFEDLQWRHLQGQPLRLYCMTLKTKALRLFETSMFTSRHGVTFRETWIFSSVDVRT
jgi:hypothetical protein